VIVLELMAVPHELESVGAGPLDQTQVLRGLLLDLEMCQQLQVDKGCQWMNILYLVVECCQGFLLTEP
jgi:hypothetical protein